MDFRHRTFILTTVLQRTIKPAFRRVVPPSLYEGLHAMKTRAIHWCRVVTRQDPWFHRDVSVPIERHGDWFLTPSRLSNTSIVYSLGIGSDIAFDLSVIERFGATVHAFDPTPSALAWLRRQRLPPQLQVTECGVANFDGEAGFGLPEEDGNPSFAYRGSVGEGDAIRCPVRRLVTLMRILGHREIDLLKMDIEGAEYGVIADFLASGVPVSQLLVEFHHRKPGIGANRTREAVAQLRHAGFSLFHISTSGREMAFLRAGTKIR